MLRLIWFLFFLSSSLTAAYIELKEGYVYLLDKTLHKSLDEGNLGIQGEAGFSVLLCTSIFINAGLFAKEGDFPQFKKRRAIVRHVGVGGKFFFPFHPRFKAYLGASLRTIFYEEINAKKHVPKERIFDVGVAPNVTSGLTYTPFCFLPLFVDLFLDYTSLNIHRSKKVVLHNTHVSLNSLFVGLGVGCCF